MSTASRLDKIEGALSPKAVLLRWFGDFYARHDSFDGYIRSAAKDPKHRTASVLLLEDICQWQKQRARVKPRMSASERAAEIVDAYLPGVLFESINQDLYQKLMTANLSEKIPACRTRAALHSGPQAAQRYAVRSRS